MTRVRVAGALTIALLALAAMTASTASASRYEKECGGYWSGTVKAHNTSCREARHLVKRFLVKAQVEGSPLTIDGFACKGRFHHDKYEVVCNKDGGKKLVRWRGGR